jgi:hypothetical protein
MQLLEEHNLMKEKRKAGCKHGHKETARGILLGKQRNQHESSREKNISYSKQLTEVETFRPLQW